MLEDNELVKVCASCGKPARDDNHKTSTISLFDSGTTTAVICFNDDTITHVR